jgi:hypothetical protein
MSMVVPMLLETPKYATRRVSDATRPVSDATRPVSDKYQSSLVGSGWSNKVLAHYTKLSPQQTNLLFGN